MFLCVSLFALSVVNKKVLLFSNHIIHLMCNCSLYDCGVPWVFSLPCLHLNLIWVIIFAAKHYEDLSFFFS